MRLSSALLLALPLLTGCGPGDEPLGTAEEPIKVCAGPTTLEGVDVSHWDGTIDFKKVKADGKVFAIMKATEGTSYVDPTFATNWADAKTAGVVRGAYHFFHANMDPMAEATHFLSTMGPLEPGDLPPTLDLEVTDSQSAATITANTIIWLDAVAAATGTKPLLYTGPSFVNSSMNNPPGLEDHAQLWVANWGVTCPDVPAPFTGWPFWQYDDKGTVSGISATAVDLDKFNGTMADLMALTVPAPSTTSSSSSSSSASSSSSSASSSSSSSSGSGEGGGTSSGSTSGNGGAGGHDDSSSGCSTAGVRQDTGAGSAWIAALALAIAVARTRRSSRVR